MNNKSLTIVLVLCGLILSSLLVRNGDLLLLGIPIVIYLLVGLSRAPTEITLSANRNLNSSSLTAFENVESQVVIENHGNRLVNVWSKDRVFPSLEMLQGKGRNRLFLRPGESVEIEYKFKTARGIYSWDAIQICASDPFGLFDLKADIPAQGELHVNPIPMAVHSPFLRPGNTIHTPGPILARLAGSGTDFWGIRQYRAGDSLRQLNWRLTARYPNKLFTNEFESEEIADFGLILDARKLTDATEIEEEIFEYSVSASASLAEEYLRKGNRVSLMIFGKPISHVFPGYGKHQLHLIQEKLASVKLGEYVSFGYLKYFPVRLFPTRSVIIVFSSVNAHDFDVYVRLRSLGYDVILISPDPINLTLKRKGPASVNRVAARIARVERAVLLNKLISEGVKVIDWQIEDHLDQTNLVFLKRSMQWWNCDGI